MSIIVANTGEVVAKWQADWGWTHTGLTGDKAFAFLGWFSVGNGLPHKELDKSAAQAFCLFPYVVKMFGELKVID